MAIRKRHANEVAGELSLAPVLARSVALKRDLLAFAQSPRFERRLAAAMLEGTESADQAGETDVIRILDTFALQHRFADGTTMVDRFVAARKDLSAADREMLLGWRDPVEGVFEVQRKDGDAVVLLNLVDDLVYRTYANVGRAAFRPLKKGGFLLARLVPISVVPGAWLVSGTLSAYPRSGAKAIAQIALDLAVKHPRLVFRNPEKIEQGWEHMRQQRAAFVEFCGGDELVLPPAEAEERLNAYYRHWQEAALARQPKRAGFASLPGIDKPFELPPELAAFDTVGIIFDDVDGMNFYPDYGMLRDLFADPALAADKRYADVLRAYLRSETIAPLPLRRLAAAHPETVDAVYCKILRKPGFTWAQHGEALLRKRKPWYYEREPRPGVSVIGARLNELGA